MIYTFLSFSAQRMDRENGPGFEALMGADSLLRQKEEEVSMLAFSLFFFSNLALTLSASL